MKAFPLLVALLSNQRCAALTASVLRSFNEGVAKKTPSDVLLETFASFASTVLHSVAQKYLFLNGLKYVDNDGRIKVMLQSLGVVSMQKMVKLGEGGAIERA